MKLAKLPILLAVGIINLSLISILVASPLVSAATFPAYKKTYSKNKLSGNLWRPKQKDLTKPASQIIVTFESSSDAKQEALADKYNADTKLEVTPKTIVLDVPDSTNVQAVADKIGKEAGVVSAEPDFQSIALGQQTSWGYSKVNAASALTTNSADGNGVVVAVIDTGVDYLHNELSSKIYNNSAETAGNGLDDDGNGFVDDTKGWDFAGATVGVSSQDNDPMDEFGHGTHVSGIIAADNDSDGVVGVAPEATIMPVKVLDDSGYGTNSSIAAGIRYATDNGADIINMSLGSPVPSSTLKNALDYAETNGVAVVAAAGNEFGWNAYSSYPAAYSNVISVAASDTNDKLAGFSNWGKIEVTAPGVDILSTVPGNRTARYSGTSMASPFVAANLALIKDKHPGFSADKLRSTLLATTDDAGPDSRDLRYGSGLMDAFQSSGSLSNSLTIESSTWRIISNGGTYDGGEATISARLLNSAGVAQSGQTVNFASDQGELSGTSAVTDGNGVATVTLGASNYQGMATVTATHGYGTASIQVLLLNDNVAAHELRVYNSNQTPTPVSTKLSGGDNLTSVIELRNEQLAYIDTVGNLNADISYAVTNANDDSLVDGLSGTLSNKAVEPNSSFFEIPFTLPSDIEDGTYRFEATVIDNNTEKSMQISNLFQVGGPKDLLIVPLTDATVDTYNTDYSSVSMQSLQPITSSLADLGESYDIWPFPSISSSSEEMDLLKQYPAVIFVGGSPSTDVVVEDYLAAGGNAYLSGNTDFPTTLGYQLDITGWCGGTGATNTNLSYDCVGQKVEPSEIAGIEDGLFDGKTYDISPYNFNTTGSQDAIVADELNGDITTDDQLEFSDGGVSNPAVAGFSRDNGVSRFVMTGFGAAAVSDSGDGRDDFLQTVLNFLRPSGQLSIDSVSNGVASQGDTNTITINGDGFEATGKTTVTIGGIKASNVAVQDRSTLTANLPNSLSVGKHDVIVTGPFGDSDTLANAVTVNFRRAQLDIIDPYFGANNADRTITLRGKYFRSGAVVKLGTRTLKGVKVQSSKEITATVPKDFAPGKYSVYVKNTDGLIDSTSDQYRVRYGFRYSASMGSYSTEVQLLEARLIEEGYLSKSAGANEYFGSNTKSALKSLQAKNKLPQSGVLDSATRSKLNNTWDLK